MITGLVLAHGAPDHLALTLGSLVPAVVEGLMGDAVVIARCEDPGLAAIAEIAGARLVVAAPGVDPWRAGAPLARREWLLCLRSGDMPDEGWIRAVDRFLGAVGRDGPPLGRFSRKGLGAAESLSRSVESVAGTQTIRAGDLVRRSWLVNRDGGRLRPVRIAARIEHAR